MRIAIFLLTILSVSFSLKAQNQDSLEIEGLILQSKVVSKNSADSAFILLEKAKVMSKAKGFTDLLAVSWYTTGKLYQSLKDWDLAEFNLLKWYEIRKSQGLKKKKWAVIGLQDFYFNSRNIEKLHVINLEYIQLLQEEFTQVDGIDVNCNFRYATDSREMISRMVSLGAYKKAESYFLIYLETCGSSREWKYDVLVYYQIYEDLLEKGRDETLKIWIDRWTSTVKEQNEAPRILAETIHIICSKGLSINNNLSYDVLTHVFDNNLAYFSKESAEKLVKRELTGWMSGYHSIYYSGYLEIKSIELSNSDKKTSTKEVFKGIKNKTKELNSKELSKLKTMLQTYGLTSSSIDVQSATQKLLKKI